jgi:L-iditol 2-dehydrogenase
MATYFAVASENLTDTVRLDDLDAKDAALTEPLACVAKSIRGLASESVGVIGLGFMGLLHMLVLPRAVGYDLNPQRCEHSRKLGLAVGDVASVQPADVVYVLPGNQGAFDLALEAVRPQGTIVMFAPLPPGQFLQMPQTAYFKDVTIRNAYSAGPSDTAQAVRWLRSGVIKAEAVVSDFISLDQLPNAYVAMRDGKILKPMVLFS